MIVTTCPKCEAPLNSGEWRYCSRCLAQALLRFEGAPEPAEGHAAVLKRVGDYELLEEIARGGMGVVFRARQVSLGREVAVKLMREAWLAKPEDVRRFRAEAAAAARLRHPGIVAIHEVGEQDGQHFFAMDLVEGMNLAERTRGGPLAPRHAAALVAKVAAAVQHAHEQGVLHRDLKPSNVLIDGEGNPWVTDFGLARPFDMDSSLTATGQVLGTPGYMPPEQAAGGRAPGPAADIYSLGALLYHLVTGRAPFFGGTLWETLRHVLDEEPVAPQLLNPEVPGDLASIAMKCLAKNPAHRYPSSAALADDLSRFLGGEPTLARPAGAGERFWRWCGRNPALAAVSGIAVLALATGVSLTLWQWQKAVAATREKQEQLWSSQRFEARSYRISKSPGQRVRALEVLRRAAAYRPSIDLRNEAIAALLLPDLTPAGSWREERFDHAPLALTGDFELSAAHRRDGNLSIRRVKDYSTAVELRTAGPEPVWMQFSPDDRWFAVAFADGTGRVWDRAWKLRKTWAGPKGPINRPTFDFTPDSRQIVWLGADGLSFHNLEDGAERNNPIRGSALRLSPSGNRAAVFQENQVALWELRSNRRLATNRFGANVASVAWHPHEETLAVGTDADGFFAWDFPLHAPRHVGAIHAAVTHLSFNSAGDLLFASGWNDVTEIWDTRDWTLLLRTTEGFARQISRDGTQLAFGREGSGYGTRGLLQPKGLRQWAVPPSLEAPTESARFTADGSWLASAHHLGWLLWDYHEGEIVARRPGKQVQSCELLPDGSGAVTCDESGINLWPIARGENERPNVADPLRLMTNGPPYIDRVALSRNGRWLAGGGLYEGVLIGLTNRNAIWLPEWPRQKSHWLAFTADSQWLVAGHHQGQSLFVHRADPYSFVTNLVTQGGRFALRPDGGILAASGNEGLTFWEVGSWRLLKTYPHPVPSRTVTVAGYSPDGRTLFVNREDRRIGLRDPENNIEFAVLDSAMESFAWSVVFHPSESRFVATSARPAIAVWDLAALRSGLRELGLDWADTSPGKTFVGPESR